MESHLRRQEADAAIDALGLIWKDNDHMEQHLFLHGVQSFLERSRHLAIFTVYDTNDAVKTRSSNTFNRAQQDGMLTSAQARSNSPYREICQIGAYKQRSTVL